MRDLTFLIVPWQRNMVQPRSQIATEDWPPICARLSMRQVVQNGAGKLTVFDLGRREFITPLGGGAEDPLSTTSTSIHPAVSCAPC
jgi:hypothetical protein